jgi:hypothetical protein
VPAARTDELVDRHAANLTESRVASRPRAIDVAACAFDAVHRTDGGARDAARELGARLQRHGSMRTRG